MVLELSDDTIAALVDEAKTRRYEPVFLEVGGEVEDPNRRQSRLPGAINSFSTAMKILHQQVSHAVRSRDSLYQPKTYSFMHSVAGGEEQDPHKDFIPETIAEVTKQYPGAIPCSMIVVLMLETRLKVFASCFDTVDKTKAMLLELRPGDAVLFRGDLIHCGMAYEHDNYHLHCYVTVAKTNFEPDLVAGVDEKVFLCQHCGHRDTESNAIRQHRIYCKKKTKARVKSPEKGSRKYLPQFLPSQQSSHTMNFGGTT
ncbi:hypothetical protein BBJ28_00012369 [Nothophytophthora sp. Chile5]|nr:hypothetical protein BBJ28_00012369 [Nothophytophthora sp. Chile5]